MERLGRIFGRLPKWVPKPNRAGRMYSRPVQPGRWDPHVTRVKNSIPKLPVRVRIAYTYIRTIGRTIFSEELL